MKRQVSDESSREKELGAGICEFLPAGIVKRMSEQIGKPMFGEDAVRGGVAHGSYGHGEIRQERFETCDGRFVVKKVVMRNVRVALR